MAKSIRSHQNRTLTPWDTLNALDVAARQQPFPLALRDKLSFIFYDASVTGLLRKKYQYVHLECLNYKKASKTHSGHRDVAIFANHQIQWTARTEFLAATQNYMKHVFHLEAHHSIGDFLFVSPKVKRHALNLTITSSISVPFHSERVWFWMRKSTWLLADIYPITIFEYF